VNGAAAEKASIPAYFSHSYKKPDREVNLFFWRLFSDEGFFFGVDPPSGLFCTAYLEILMRWSACFVGVLTHRPAVAELRCSPYMLFEYGLAVQANKPRLIFVEDGVPERFFQAQDLLLFDRQSLDQVSDDFRGAIRKLRARAGQQRDMRPRTKGRVGLALGGPAYPESVIAALKDLLRPYGYEVERVRLDFERSFSFAVDLDRYDFLVLDVGPSAIADWLAPFVFGRFIPSIKLCYQGEGQAVAAEAISPLAARYFRDRGEKDDVVLAWASEKELLAHVERQALRFAERTQRTYYQSLAQGEIYLRSAERRAGKVFVSNAGEANPFAEALAGAFDRAGIHYFHYQFRNSFRVGERWNEQIEPTIDECELVLQLYTRGYDKSDTCVREEAHARRRVAEGKLRLVACLLEDLGAKIIEEHGIDLKNVTDQAERIRRIVERVDEILSGPPPPSLR